MLALDNEQIQSDEEDDLVIRAYDSSDSDNDNDDNNTNDEYSRIDPTKLSSKFLTGKIKAYTLDETEEAIQTIDDIPDVLVLHSLTNDLTTKQKEECVNKMDKIIEDTHKRHPDLKIIISLPTPRADDESLNIKAQMLSIMLKEKFNNKDNVTLCDNSNMAYKGTPIQKFLDSKDKYHLSNSGFSIAHQTMQPMKGTIERHKILNMINFKALVISMIQFTHPMKIDKVIIEVEDSGEIIEVIINNFEATVDKGKT
ncbi:unnamed protein product [Mytilus coruscus]|uniref:SGNH hydrolase-type esterase domain-containing protein n=1 Tax=Mytilus coruscus TaxID=42192 RepID=A0A6J8C2U6_MYTCO|nr:unnamed protein product [Mytilus coruscus]